MPPLILKLLQHIISTYCSDGILFDPISLSINIKDLFDFDMKKKF